MSILSIATIPYPAFSPVLITSEVDPTITATIGSDTAVGTEFIAGAITLPVTALYYDPCTCDPVPPTPGDLPDDADPPFPPVYPYLFSTDDIYGRDHLSLNLKMVRGDTYKFNATIVLNGSPVDLTGGVVRMTAKWSLSDSDSDAVFQVSSATGGIVITSATAGEISVTIAADLTEPLPSRKVELPYDIQFVNSVSEVYTVLYGTLLIVPDATITS